MSKILYIAPFRDFSGYSYAARGYLKALHMAGTDLVARAIRYDRADAGTEYQPTELEKELLKRPLDNIDVVMQHCTPNEMRPVGGKINIAITAWETTHIPKYWADKLNKFNAVITFCSDSVKAFQESGVTVPVFEVPHTFDIASYNLDGVDEIHSPNDPSFLENKFVFYNISQLSTKKGIDILLRAYFAQFHGKKDNVILILKTYIDMSGRDQERQKLLQYINSVKAAMRLPADGYPNVMLVHKTLTDTQIKKLHKTGDCYVSSSRGEGWNIPLFEAMAYGRRVIATDWGGQGVYCDWIATDHDVALNVDYFMEPLVGQSHADPELFTAKDFIAEPSVSSMMSQMQKAYDLRQTPVYQLNLDRFDHKTVGPSMLNVVEEIANGVKVNV